MHFKRTGCDRGEVDDGKTRRNIIWNKAILTIAGAVKTQQRRLHWYGHLERRERREESFCKGTLDLLVEDAGSRGMTKMWGRDCISEKIREKYSAKETCESKTSGSSGSSGSRKSGTATPKLGEAKEQNCGRVNTLGNLCASLTIASRCRNEFLYNPFPIESFHFLLQTKFLIHKYINIHRLIWVCCYSIWVCTNLYNRNKTTEPHREKYIWTVSFIIT